MPGTGTISLKRKAAELDFANKIFTPPRYYFDLDSTNEESLNKHVEWLAGFLKISESAAFVKLNEFSKDLQNQIASAGEFTWQDVGKFFKNNNGELVFDSGTFQLDAEVPVSAEKVIREKAEHTILVGEMEMSAAEMEELLGENEVKKDYSMVIAVILTIISFMFIVLFISEKGFQPSAAGNQTIIRLK